MHPFSLSEMMKNSTVSKITQRNVEFTDTTTSGNESRENFKEEEEEEDSKRKAVDL